MEKEMLLVKTIEEKRKMPKDVKNNIIWTTVFNILMAIIMLCIVLGTNIMFKNLALYDFREYIKYVQLTVGFALIIMFEVAYKKDSGKIAIYAIEFSIFSIAVLYVSYMYIFKRRLDFLKNIVIGFTIYYILKSLFLAFSYRNKYIKDNISDVKEIVKDEKQGYIDEESSKTLRERRKEDKKREQELKQKQKLESKQAKQKQIVKKNNVKKNKSVKTKKK